MWRSALAIASVSSVAFAQTANVDNLSTNQQGSSISSNSNNSSVSNTYNGPAPGAPAQPPATAIAPAYFGGGTDSCLIGASGAVSSTVIGVSMGTYRRDEICEMLKLSKQLDSMGLKIAAASILCQDARVFMAMAMAGTPCPFLGAIGRQATLQWQQNPEWRPDYALTSSQPLRPLSLGSGIQVDTGGSLSDRFRPSRRAVLNAKPESGGDKPVSSERRD